MCESYESRRLAEGEGMWPFSVVFYTKSINPAAQLKRVTLRTGHFQNKNVRCNTTKLWDKRQLSWSISLCYRGTPLEGLRKTVITPEVSPRFEPSTPEFNSEALKLELHLSVEWSSVIPNGKHNVNGFVDFSKLFLADSFDYNS